MKILLKNSYVQSVFVLSLKNLSGRKVNCHFKNRGKDGQKKTHDCFVAVATPSLLLFIAILNTFRCILSVELAEKIS